MAVATRLLGAGKILLLVAALLGTFVASFAIAMRLALASRDVLVPDLAGLSVNDASSQLADLGLTLTEAGRRLDPSTPADRIVDQEPAAGTRTRQPRRIRVWLSNGPHADAVPLVVGESQRTAELRLEHDGLTLRGVAELRSSAYPPGVVVAQHPPALVPATEVDLLVNRGERTASFVMPDLIGLEGTQAAEFLRRHGFRVTLVPGQPYPGVPAGVVLRHAPRAGFAIVPGEPISLEVSQE
jgi:serine/threonine-protein kinase